MLKDSTSRLPLLAVLERRGINAEKAQIKHSAAMNHATYSCTFCKHKSHCHQYAIHDRSIGSDPNFCPNSKTIDFLENHEDLRVPPVILGLD